METMRRKRKKKNRIIEGAPRPLVNRQVRRVRYSEVDIMGIVWYGKYAEYLQEGAAALGRLCGLSYSDFYKSNLHVPIVELHIDYLQPLILDEVFTLVTSLIWNEGSRLNTEYALIKKDETIAATAHTVQMFINAKSREIYLTSPLLLEHCRKLWKEGEFNCLS